MPYTASHRRTVRRPVGHRLGARGTAAAVSGALALASLSSLIGSAPDGHAATSAPALATIHPVAAVTVADTHSGVGVPRKSLGNRAGFTVSVAGHHGLPAAATSVTVAVVVTGATGTGQVRLGPTKSELSPAVAVTKGHTSTASYTSLLSGGKLSGGYFGTGHVQVQLVVEAWTADDLTGSSLHPIAAVRVADTTKGRGVPAHALRKYAAVHVQIAGADGIPRNATSVLLTVNTVSPTTTGTITAGRTAGASAPVIAFSKGEQATGGVLTPLAADGTVTLVNSSSGSVGITVTVAGYFTADTSGLLFRAMAPDRIADTGTGLGLPRKPLSTTAVTVSVRSAARLPESAAAAVLSLTVPAHGLSAVSSGSGTGPMSTALLTRTGEAAATSVVVPLSSKGTVALRATGKPTRVTVVVLGYWAPRVPGQPTSGGTNPPPGTPGSTPPGSTPPGTTPPTDAPPTTSPQAHPYVSGVTPANGATGVDPQTTSVVADTFRPGGGVATSSLDATSTSLVNTRTGGQVTANYSTSGGADTINVSPIAPLDPNTTYRFTVTTRVTDVDGVSFLPFSSTFTTGAVVVPDSSIAFDHYDSGATGHSFASLVKGPDGKLYASTLDGWIYRYTINGDGTLGNPQAISTVRDHAVAAGLPGAPSRTIIGLAFDPSSTSSNLILWITDNTSYNGTTDPNNYLPDFSDHLAKLTGNNLQTYTDVLSGLPRSVKDHESNSITFHNGLLYVDQAANNAMGDADATWGNRADHLLNAAILQLDVSKLPAQLPLNVQTYDAGGSYDPYAANAPLTLYATGVRNAFDLVWASNGHLYAPTNGSAAFGNSPGTPSPLPAGACAHRPDGSYSGPAVPALTANPVAETDFIFDVKQGRYYGHPDPSRCEYVLDGGNPTAATDAYEVGAYPVGTPADPNYDVADVYDAGLHASADGALQYSGSAFNGELNGKLLVVRYSEGQDIETFDVAANGRLTNRTVGIKGFTGFQSPLDIAEDNATGNLYVSELGSVPGDIELLKPRPSTAPALLSITNNDTIPSNSRVALSRIQNTNTSVPGSVETFRDGDTLILKATGGAAVTINSLSTTGPFSVTSPPALPYHLAAGQSLNLVVHFSGTTAGVTNGTLTVQTNAANQATRTIQLSGYFQSVSEAGEPTPHDLAGMMGWTTNVPAILDDNGHVQADGDEVLATTFTRVDPTQPVYVRQVAEYSTFPTSSTFSFYDPATPNQPSAVVTSKDTWAQSVVPSASSGSLPAAGSFLPPSSRFGFKVDTEFSQDALNNTAEDQAAGCTTACGHHIRVFPVKDGSGNLVAGTYFVVVDLSGAGENYDYNDAAYVVSNIQP